MGSPAVHLQPLDLAIATLLILVTAVISLVLRLKVEGRLLWAGLRTVVQLLLVGFVLRWVFELDRPALIGAVMLLMVAAAARAAVQRSTRRLPGLLGGAFVSLVLVGGSTSVLASAVIIGVEPWYAPQYLIPILGMMLGNGLTGISLCVDTMLETFDERRAEVEADLAMGATAWEAARDPFRQAVRRGMIPILNAMSVAGIVSLPGMMTGQILAGADPTEAAKYQILIMFLIATTTTLSCIGIGGFIFRRCFTPRHQLKVLEIQEQVARAGRKPGRSRRRL